MPEVILNRRYINQQMQHDIHCTDIDSHYTICSTYEHWVPWSFFALAVQEERQRAREKCESELENSTFANNEMPVEEILQAELAVDPQMESYLDAEEDPVSSICQAADK